MERKAEIAEKRIPVTPTAFEAVRDFSRGMDMEYSDIMMFLLRQVVGEKSDYLVAGRKMKASLTKGHKE